MKTFSAIFFILILSGITALADIAVFAASSTTELMKELAEEFKVADADAVRFNFASSGALARQIEAGAPADIFVSANTKWMDWLEEKSAIRQKSRVNLAANTLVMVAAPDTTHPFDGTSTGRIAVGDLKSVPAGMYAKEALEYLGWMEHLRPQLIMSSNVRTALLYVQRGEVAAGIVYATDAKAAGLPIIGTFPADSHSPIVYPAAACSEKASALKFLEFLKSDKAKAILKEYGFSEPNPLSFKAPSSRRTPKD